ncbi:MAG: hypothetical protein L0Y71_13785 [Gemmataceae bacterium]|nr:hypothetical protein [Gemmataceae bacterium]
MSEPAIPPRSIRERLEELYRRLHALPHAESAEAAFRQLCDTLDQVEDEWSGIVKKSPPPAPSEFDGRMYCPLDDFVAQLDDGGILALTRGHRIEIAAHGAVRIVNKLTGLPEFEK